MPSGLGGGPTPSIFPQSFSVPVPTALEHARPQPALAAEAPAASWPSSSVPRRRRPPSGTCGSPRGRFLLPPTISPPQLGLWLVPSDVRDSPRPDHGPETALPSDGSPPPPSPFRQPPPAPSGPATRSPARASATKAPFVLPWTFGAQVEPAPGEDWGHVRRTSLGPSHDRLASVLVVRLASAEVRGGALAAPDVALGHHALAVVPDAELAALDELGAAGNDAPNPEALLPTHSPSVLRRYGDRSTFK